MMSDNQVVPMVSVLMTAYNRERYIAEAVESVLASTYQNFELIIVDDCSKDKTLEIARHYEQKDQRILVRVNDKNLGDYPNRNKAASYAKGKYLKYVDADDYIYPWGLELLTRMMEQFPSAGWGLCSLEQCERQPFPFMLSPRETYGYQYEGPGLFHKAPLSSIIKREIFEEAGGFAHQRMAGDFEMWHRLALKYNVVLMPHGMVWYREHGEQEINSYHQFSGAYEKVITNYLKSDQCPLDKTIRNKLLRNRRNSIALQVLKSLLKINPKQINSNWGRLKAYYAK